MDISRLSITELKDLLTSIPKEIELRKKVDKAQLRKELEVLAAQRGFNLDELIGSPIKKERLPVATKYRHPSNSELTWTGRGRKPKWVADFIQAGGQIDQLSI